MLGTAPAESAVPAGSAASVESAAPAGGAAPQREEAKRGKANGGPVPSSEWRNYDEFAPTREHPVVQPPRAPRGPREGWDRTSGGPVESTVEKKADDRLSFVAAYPPTVVPGDWYPMLVVLHTASAQAQVDELLARRAPELGGAPARSATTAGTAVARGTTLTLVPAVAGVEFNPPRLDVTWYEDVQEANFRMRAAGPAGAARYGAVEVFAGALLVAVIPVGIRTELAGAPQWTPTATSRVGVLDRIFVSYSRRDAEVVETCTTVYRALGVQILRDTVDLRSGQDWRQALHELISQADLFQLYWSSSAAHSSEVANEWKFARTLTDKGPSFIRPLYWESPMPPAPDELGGVHFSRMELPELST